MADRQKVGGFFLLPVVLGLQLGVFASGVLLWLAPIVFVSWLVRRLERRMATAH